MATTQNALTKEQRALADLQAELAQERSSKALPALNHGEDKESMKARNAVKNAKRARYFCMEFYPEDDQGMMLFNYIKINEGGLYPHIAYILHDRDVYTEDGTHKEKIDGEIVEVNHVAGDKKKAHWHVVIHTQSQSTPEAISKFFLGTTVFKVENVENYLMYLLHSTPESIHKAPYSIDELKGSAKLLDKIKVQKSNFVQLRECIRMMREGIPVLEMIELVEDSKVLNAEQKNDRISFILQNANKLVMIEKQWYDRRQIFAQQIQEVYKQAWDQGYTDAQKTVKAVAELGGDWK